MSRPSVDRCHPAARTPTGPDTVDWDCRADWDYTVDWDCTAAPVELDCPSLEAFPALKAADKQVARAAPGTVAGLAGLDIAAAPAVLDTVVALAATGPVERVVPDFAVAPVALAALDIAADRVGLDIVALDSVAPGSAAAAD